MGQVEVSNETRGFICWFNNVLDFEANWYLVSVALDLPFVILCLFFFFMSPYLYFVVFLVLLFCFVLFFLFEGLSMELLNAGVASIDHWGDDSLNGLCTLYAAHFGDLGDDWLDSPCRSPTLRESPSLRLSFKF